MRWAWCLAAVVACGGGKGGGTGAPPTGGGTGGGAGTGTGTPTGTWGGTGVAGLDGAWRVAELGRGGAVSVEGDGHMGVVQIAAGGTIAADLVDLADEVPVGPFARQDWTYAIDGDRLVLTTADGVQVFGVSGQDDQRDLVWDELDARNQPPPTPFESLHLERLDPPLMEGAWRGTRWDLGPVVTFLDQCFPVDATTWTWSTLSMTVDAGGVVEIATTDERFSDDACTASLGPAIQRSGRGFWRDDAPNAELWMAWEDGSRWDLVNAPVSGDEVVLSRLDCRRSPDCLGEGFDALTVVRQP